MTRDLRRGMIVTVEHPSYPVLHGRITSVRYGLLTGRTTVEVDVIGREPLIVPAAYVRVERDGVLS